MLAIIGIFIVVGAGCPFAGTVILTFYTKLVVKIYSQGVK